MRHQIVTTHRLVSLTALALLAGAAAFSIDLSSAPAAPRALHALPSVPPAGLSVEAKDASFDKGFDFKFKSDNNSTATISIDPLGLHHSDSASLSSTSGSIALSGKYSNTTRTIEITAKRGGTQIGEYSWRVHATLK